MGLIKVKISEYGTVATEAHPTPTGWNDSCDCLNCKTQQAIQKNLKSFVIDNGKFEPNSIQMGEVLENGKIKIIN